MADWGARGAEIRLPMTEGSVKVHLQADAVLGAAVWWEQKYFLSLLAVDGRANAGRSRKRDKRQNVVENLLEAFGLGGDDYIVGDPHRSGGVKWTRMSTKYLLFWMMRTLHVHRHRDDHLRPAQRVWSILSTAAEQAFGAERISLDVCVAGGIHTVPVNCEAGFAETAALIAAIGTTSICQQWEVHSKDSELLRGAGNPKRPTLPGWALFLYLWQAGGARTLKPSWLRAHLVDVVDLLAVSLERFVQRRVVDVPPKRWDENNALIDLRTATGRRQSIDPSLYSHINSTRQRVRGSANTVAQVLAGRRTHAHQTSQMFICNTYRTMCAELLDTAEAICVNWDPGSYTGDQWTLGIW